MREDEEGSLGREHADLHPGEVRDVLAPDAGGIDSDVRVVLAALVRLVVIGLYAHDPVTVLDESGNLRIQKDLRSVELRVHHIGGAQAERVHAAVGDLHGANQLRIQGRFHPEGVLRVHDLGRNPGGKAGLHELRLVVEVVLRQGDEKAVGLVHAVGGDPAEDHVLADAFVGRFLVGDGVARPGMQEAVVPARRTGGDVVPLDEKDSQPPHRAVPGRAGPGNAAADDDDVVLVPFHGMFTYLWVCSDSRHCGCRRI